MKAKLWITIAIVVAVLLVVWQLASPFLTFRSLAEAGRAGDRERLAALVDFPAVRENLKTQLAARLTGAMARDDGLSRSPFGALGALLAPTLVDQLVDTAVTPDGVAAIIRSSRPPFPDGGAGKTALPPPPETAPPPPGPADAPPPKPRTRYAWAGLNRFQATTWPNDDPDAPLTWVLERRGLGWKLAAIELPPARS